MTAKENILLSVKQFRVYDEERAALIAANEDRLDLITDKADSYMIELQGHIETETDTRERSILMQCIRDIERIGDYASNFDELALRLKDEKTAFSERRSCEARQ